MVNCHRGDVPLLLAGKTHVLRLTLGGLAGLEQALGAETLAELADRFCHGAFSARHLCLVLAAGFDGAGKTIEAEQLARDIPASALEEATLVAATLLAAAFGGGSPSRPPPPQVAHE